MDVERGWIFERGGGGGWNVFIGDNGCAEVLCVGLAMSTIVCRHKTAIPAAGCGKII